MTSQTDRRRRNAVQSPLFWGVLVAALIGVGAGAVMLPTGDTNVLLDLPTAEVRRGPMVISVTESGTIRPREQIMLKNELDDPATIISIVEEGSRVSKGDLLVELDVTETEAELVERRIRVQSAEANVIFAEENLKIAESQGLTDIETARLQYQFAKSDLTQYLQGEFPKLVKEAQATIAIAEEELIRAQETLNWSNVLFAEKYLSRTALQQDELAMKKAQLAVDLAKADLDLLQKHTYARQLATLEAAVKQTEAAVERTQRKINATLAQARADMSAKRALLEEEKAELEEVEAEVAKSKIYAPIDGMVLYASSISDDWDDDEPLIDVGATVDEQGEIIYLPTTGAYNVDVKILEVDLQKINTGQPVRVVVDALPGQSFSGRVVSISPLPDSQSRWLNPNLKLYNTVIAIDDAGPALRNGMSCRVEIFVANYADAIHVPIQAVTRVNGQPTVHVVQANRIVPQPVEIGLDNGRFVHVLAGLQEDQVVLLTPPLSNSDEMQRRQQEQLQRELSEDEADQQQEQDRDAPEIDNANDNGNGNDSEQD